MDAVLTPSRVTQGQADVSTNGAVRLNLGAGDTQLDGYASIDRKNGKEVFPLDCPDESVEEIYASHILEHFKHGEVSDVLNEWVRKLKPGGRIRIAVPDFKWIAENYLDRKPINVQGYTMGGQVDGDDIHHAIFDQETLLDIMIAAGLERIGTWTSTNGDSAALPCSLNLQGFRPSSNETITHRTAAVLSAPRYGPVSHAKAASAAFFRANVPYNVSQGAYWSQILCQGMEGQLKNDIDFLFTVDFDSIFTWQDVVEMYRLIKAYTEVDALCALQSRRGSEHALFGMRDADGYKRLSAYAVEFDRHMTPVATGHFGLTIFRASSLRAHERPWMVPSPGADGCWGAQHVDADIDFWERWRKAGRTLYLANQIVIGHVEELITWPSSDYTPIHQTVFDYAEKGIPPEVRR